MPIIVVIRLHHLLRAVPLRSAARVPGAGSPRWPQALPSPRALCATFMVLWAGMALLAPAADAAAATQIAAGGDHSCAVLASGQVDCWGGGYYGQLGNGENANSSTPVRVGGITDATAIAAGGEHSCAVLSTGRVDCWGYNGSGELGTGTTTNSSTPVRVSGISTATAVAAGGVTGSGYSCALLSSGRIDCWGANRTGQLGDGTTTDRHTPVAVSGITNATAIAAGGASGIGHSCAVLSSGRVDCWGSNDFGELGDGSTASSSTPVMVSGLGGGLAIAAGSYHSCAVLSNHLVECWGNNSDGQLGHGGTMGSCCSSTPVAVSGITNATAIAAGVSHSCAAVSGDQVKCWGVNGNGQLGNGTSGNSSTPVAVSRPMDAPEIVAGQTHSCALLSVGGVVCWGSNYSGQLGDGETTDSHTPVAVTGLNGNAHQLLVSAPDLPDGTAGTYYSGGLSATGGTRPYHWSIMWWTPQDGLSLARTTGGLSGTPPYSGTVNFTATVTDSSTPTPKSASEILQVTIQDPEPPTMWNHALVLCAGGPDTCHPPSHSHKGGPVVGPHPDVAYVLVGSWWCSLFGHGGHPPPLCGSSHPSEHLEQAALTSAVTRLVKRDYNSSYDNRLSQFYDVTGCGAFSSCTTTYVGDGVQLRPYVDSAGTSTEWAGPVSQAHVQNEQGVTNTLNTLINGFGGSSKAGTKIEKQDTVFVFLYAPPLLSGNCTQGNPSFNHWTSSDLGFHYAKIYLADYNHECAGDLGGYPSGPAHTITPEQFATFATSHEVDEALVSPVAGQSEYGWWFHPQNWQVADPCAIRNADGATTSGTDPNAAHYPYHNFTRDSLGTVVAAYAGPTEPAVCYPAVSSAIPPG
jgi:alpha-tubulin suppressor-like RCC1 family protein